jgi:5-methylthioadenosine/S-adenosylhomocysteine deaminase
MRVARFMPAIIVSSLLTLGVCGRSQGQESNSYALRGTLVTPQSVVPGGILLVSGEKIGGAGANVDLPPGTIPIETDSYIFPGLIDLHNHLTWNIFPRWKPEAAEWNPNLKFGTRYDWQQVPSMDALLETPHRVLYEEGWGCEMNRYGEVKAIAGGATSAIGGLEGEPCIEGLARNLDYYSGIYQQDVLNAEKIVYETFPFQMPVKNAEGVRGGLASGALSAFIIHVAEGAAGNASAAREYTMFVANGFLRPGVSIVHGVALGPPQFQEMAAHGVGLVWSPRSNLELYGSTADVRSAKKSGVVIAIAPDWSPSGSSGILEELKYAAEWNNRQHPKVFENADFVKMATIYPAQLAGLSEHLGSLTRGHLADLLLLKRKNADAYAAILNATPMDVRLVVIGGVPVYGDKDLMEKLLPQKRLEAVRICGTSDQKVLYLGPDASLGGLGKTWKDTTDHLSLALQQWNIKLSDLAEPAECGQ